MTHDDELRDALYKIILDVAYTDKRDKFPAATETTMRLIHAYVEMRVAEAVRKELDSDDKNLCECMDRKLERVRSAWRKAIGGE